MSTLGKQQTERLMLAIEQEREDSNRRSIRNHLNAWRLELKDRAWRAQACVAAGVPYDQAALEEEIKSFKTVIAVIKSLGPDAVSDGDEA